MPALFMTFLLQIQQATKGFCERHLIANYPEEPKDVDELFERIKKNNPKTYEILKKSYPQIANRIERSDAQD